MTDRTKIFFIFFVAVIIFISLFEVPNTLAFKASTHKVINRYISQQTFNDFSLDDYLKNKLGMSVGFDTQLGDKKVYEWLSHGGEVEDSSVGLRYMNHFLEPINNVGLWGHENAAAWTLMVAGGQSIAGENYSWNDARAYYFKALTSPSRYVRETSFAKTFRALGQVMHLVQDMSVPEHARDDAHGFGSVYEKWAAGKDAPAISSYALYIPFTPAPDYPLTVANLFDTDRYTGANPDVTTENTTIGLAEYTNANFLSPDTIFSDFPYPAYAGMTAEVLDGDKLYLVKAEDTGTDRYLALAQNFYAYLPEDYKKLALTTKDNAVHKNYANHLIPRAIGYSSQVLSYFFRGDMGLVADGNGCYIVNNLDEGIEGTFELFYDNTGDERVQVKTVDQYPWRYTTGISASGESGGMTFFAVPQDAKTPGEFVLVMKGGMGNEISNAVAASKITIPLVELSLPTEGVYAITDHHPYYEDTSDPRYVSDPAQYGFNKIVVNAKNISQAGNMSGGTVALQVKYRLGQADQFTYPPGATSNNTFYRIVAEKSGVTIPSGASTRLEFDLPYDLPLWATDVHLFLVYNGTVGTQSNVLCLGYKDISEPTPVDIINRMDKACLNGKLYDAGSAEAIAVVDPDGNGIANVDVYAHGLEDLTLWVGGGTYTAPFVDAGAVARPVFFLGNYTSSTRASTLSYPVKLQSEDPFNHSNIDYYAAGYIGGIKNQLAYYESFPGCSTSPCWVRHVPRLKSYNGFYAWSGFMATNAPYPSGSVCTYED